MANHGGWHFDLKHIFSISNTEDFHLFLDIFTNKLNIGVNFFFKAIYMMRALF